MFIKHFGFIQKTFWFHWQPYNREIPNNVFKIWLCKTKKYRISFWEPVIWNTFLDATEKNIEWIVSDTEIFSNTWEVSQKRHDKLSFRHKSWHYHTDFWSLLSILGKNIEKGLNDKAVSALCKSRPHLLIIYLY